MPGGILFIPKRVQGALLFTSCWGTCAKIYNLKIINASEETQASEINNQMKMCTRLFFSLDQGNSGK